ncbi:PREDICTED: lamin-like protein [Ipomoea nil]|uniref:lamin-like protein n=1 Tax=Ipomoea nil TaxID=35883 RepID=UPI0009015C51|nr:PREDICTED: lamin-like protein [Ipomoea nil]
MEGVASGVMARKVVGAVWLPLVFGSLLLTSALGDRIKVGGNVGWTPNVNYTEWAAKQHFYVGDWLYFVFDKHYYSVLEVNSSNYETCNDREFITNITRGGRDVFQLNETRPYYFLSSGGYCWSQMKMAINVEHHPPPAPSPSQSKNHSPPLMFPQTVSLSVVLAMALSAAFMFL